MAVELKEVWNELARVGAGSMVESVESRERREERREAEESLDTYL